MPQLILRNYPPHFEADIFCRNFRFYFITKEQIKAAILSDELSEGDMLPSIRQLAKDLKISVITTTRAYSDLEQEGFIAVQQGKGCFVLPKNSEIVREQLMRKIEDCFVTAVNTGKTAKLSHDDYRWAKKSKTCPAE